MSNGQRRYPRHTRRIQVRYRVEGEERLRRGFTKNISLAGALVTGNDLPSRGSLLRMELAIKGVERVVYARVVHAHQVPAELRRFAESVMGVHFLRRRQLIAPFLGDAETAEVGSASAKGEGAGRPGGDGFAQRSWPISGGHSSGVSLGEGKGDGAGGSKGPEKGARKAAARAPELDAARTYELRYETPNEFLVAYRRDLVNGGLWVATPEPASLHATVTVQLHLPPPVRQVFRFEARVVQSVEGRQLPGGANGGGVGLEVLDTDRVLKDLQPVIDLLR